MDFKIPVELLKNNTLFVDNNVDNIYPIKYDEDEIYAYFRIESKLEDLNFNIISKDLEREYMTGLGKINLSPITYFLISILLAIIVFVTFNIPKRVYEKYKAIRFVEKEVIIAEKFIEKEEKIAKDFIKKEEKIIASKFKKKPNTVTKKAKKVTKKTAKKTNKKK
ncbi:hypothetical protein KY334_06325 [Candidatus Woesearchaeota archaeon]|nr:hypothetical protein [Candidatus Woesearchaeota archaeon]